MAPSFDCMISLLCPEEASGGDWEDETGSYGAQEHVEADPVAQSLSELPVEDDDIITLLVEKEAGLMPQFDYTEKFESKIFEWSSRENAVSWMLDVHSYYQFDRLTAYLSVNYLDRFLSNHTIPLGKAWMLQLLAVGCVSLAAKIEETDVPFLLDLQVGEVQHVFEARTIQRMELLILSTLKWRMNSVTPFSYVNYMLHKIGISRRSSSAFASRVEELILSTCRVMRFLVYRPSVIAVACIISVGEELVPMHAATFKNVLLSALPTSEGIMLECARVVQELLRDPFWTSNKRISPNLSAPQSPIGVLDAACFSCDSDTTTSTTQSVNGLSNVSNQVYSSIDASPVTVEPSSTLHDVPRKRKFHEVYSVTAPTATE